MKIKFVFISLIIASTCFCQEVNATFQTLNKNQIIEYDYSVNKIYSRRGGHGGHGGHSHRSGRGRGRGHGNHDAGGAILFLIFMGILLVGLFFEKIFKKFKKTENEDNAPKTKCLPYGSVSDFEANLKKMGLCADRIKIEVEIYKKNYNIY